MQAIVTKYIGPTNHRGSRVKATCQAKSITLEWDDSRNSEMNHANAAHTLATKLGWDGTWHMGGLPDGTIVFVCEHPSDRDFGFIVPKSAA